MEFNVKITGLDSLMEKLDSKNLKNAITSAINRTAIHVRSELAKNVAKEYNISANEFKGDMITIQKANWDRPAVVRVRASKRIPLIKFVTQLRVLGRAGRIRNKRFNSLSNAAFGSISYAVQRGKTKEMNDVIVADFKYGPQIYKRIPGAPRHKQLKALYALSGNQAIRTKGVMDNIREDAQQFMRARLIHELKYRSGSDNK